MDNLSRTLEDFDLAHILDNSVDGRMPALQCMTDNSGPRPWLRRPAEDWRRIAADTRNRARPLAQQHTGLATLLIGGILVAPRSPW